jgi:hypothetical protein
VPATLAVQCSHDLLHLLLSPRLRLLLG